MAVLKNCASGHRVVLSPQHVVGRAPTCGTVLDDLEASRLHAVIRWAGHRWELLDLSRNGTVVDEHRVPKEVAIVLHTGQSILFGVDAPSSWTVEDVGPPAAAALPEDDGGHRH